ncbi:uncharacterized protein LOC106738108 [Alligator mississippiensis]|uniref:Uncharacterized protein n=1 Tax=Alligator mississippiensis TaxID=8496 RepID=A0A151P1C6_ALLMI|nr:uncharacterized protein LOC106738108 [Alligator mississippiensis]KYO42892.1 hypothetical protein Y1Q_0016658 [Alligator mississippiensis]
MAPSVAERPKSPAVPVACGQLQWGLGSVAPALLAILLLLLCLPFKRKNRHFSTQSVKMRIESSTLISMKKLPSNRNLGGKPRQAAALAPAGGSQPGDPGPRAKMQTNGFAASAHRQPGDCRPLVASPRAERECDIVALTGQRPGPEAAGRPNPAAAESPQCQELPWAPRDVPGALADARQDADGPIYESITEKDVCSWLGALHGAGEAAGAHPGPAAAMGLSSQASKGAEGPAARASQCNSTLEQAFLPPQPGYSLKRPPLQVQELVGEESPASEPLHVTGKELQAMYARVCKKPRERCLVLTAAPATAPEPEDEPPPLPEKRFDLL